MSYKSERKQIRQSMKEHLDMIAVLQARRRVATQMPYYGCPEMADGANEDILRRKRELEAWSRRLEELERSHA